MFPDQWWKAVLAIPVVFCLWVVIRLRQTAYALSIGLDGQEPFNYATSAIIVVFYGVTLFAPFAFYHDRRFVSERYGWTPSLLYLLVVLPLWNVPLATVYVLRRHRIARAAETVAQ